MEIEVLASFRILQENSLKTLRKTSVRVAGLRSKVRKVNLPNRTDFKQAGRDMLLALVQQQL
jgi:hypothetical protein